MPRFRYWIVGFEKMSMHMQIIIIEFHTLTDAIFRVSYITAEAALNTHFLPHHPDLPLQDVAQLLLPTGGNISSSHLHLLR